MTVLSMPEISKLKEVVRKSGYIVHLHDACGAQSFTLEPAGDNPTKQVYEEIEKFFSEYQLTVHFYDNEKLNFVVR